MISWITENTANIVVIAILLVMIGAAVFSMIHNRKKGRSLCGGSCCSCPYGESCKKAGKDEDNGKS